MIKKKSFSGNIKGYTGLDPKVVHADTWEELFSYRDTGNWRLPYEEWRDIAEGSTFIFEGRTYILKNKKIYYGDIYNKTEAVYIFEEEGEQHGDL